MQTQLYRLHATMVQAPSSAICKTVATPAEDPPWQPHPSMPGYKIRHFRNGRMEIEAPEDTPATVVTRKEPPYCPEGWGGFQYHGADGKADEVVRPAPATCTALASPAASAVETTEHGAGAVHQRPKDAPADATHYGCGLYYKREGGVWFAMGLEWFRSGNTESWFDKNVQALPAAHPDDWQSGAPPVAGWYIAEAREDLGSMARARYFDGSGWSSFAWLHDPLEEKRRVMALKTHRHVARYRGPRLIGPDWPEHEAKAEEVPSVTDLRKAFNDAAVRNPYATSVYFESVSWWVDTCPPAERAAAIAAFNAIPAA